MEPGTHEDAQAVMRVVLDTNVLLVSLPKASPYRPIFDALIQGRLTLLVSEGIFQEYVEIIARKTNEEIARNVAELLCQLENVELVKIYFNWDLITQDPDDNKFVDCAIAGNAKYIVTNDAHFKVLERIDFPKIDVIQADDFLAAIQGL